MLLSDFTWPDWLLGFSPMEFINTIGGVAGVVLVVFYFLKYLEKHDTDHRRFYAESQAKFQEQLDRRAREQESSQDQFQAQITRIANQQNEVIRDVVVALNGMAGTVKGLELLVQRAVEVDAQSRRRRAATADESIIKITP